VPIFPCPRRLSLATMLWVPLPDSVTLVLHEPPLPTVAVPSAVALPSSEQRHRGADVRRRQPFPDIVWAAWLTEPPAVVIETVGAVVSICRMPVGLTLFAPARTARLPAASLIVPPFSVSALAAAVARSAVSWPLPLAPHRIVEHQCGCPAAADIGRRGAVAQRQRRRSAAGVDRNRLAEADRERQPPCQDHHRPSAPQIEDTVGRRGVDLQDAGRVDIVCAGEDGEVACRILDRAARSASAHWPPPSPGRPVSLAAAARPHRIVEHQCGGPAAADIGRRGAVAQQPASAFPRAGVDRNTASLKLTVNGTNRARTIIAPSAPQSRTPSAAVGVDLNAGIKGYGHPATRALPAASVIEPL